MLSTARMFIVTGSHHLLAKILVHWTPTYQLYPGVNVGIVNQTASQSRKITVRRKVIKMWIIIIIFVVITIIIIIIIMMKAMKIKMTHKLLPHVSNSNYYFKIQNWNYTNETLPHLHIIPFNVQFTTLVVNTIDNFTVISVNTQICTYVSAWVPYSPQKC